MSEEITVLSNVDLQDARTAENSEDSIAGRSNAQGTTATTSTCGSNRVDSLLSGVKWSSNVLTYSFPVVGSSWPSNYSSSGENNIGFQPLTEQQRSAATLALQSWANVCNLTFSLVSEPSSSGVIRLARSSAPTTSWAYYPSYSEAGGDVWFGTGTYAPDNPIVGTYDYITFVHELGHTLGLKHPHDSARGVVCDLASDDMEFSVMSYRSYIGASVTGGYTNYSNSYATTPMMSDIAAVQYMYGANFTYNAGNTVYRWQPGTSKIFETVWDGGGNDTYDLSAYQTGVAVNLNPGEWSTFSSSQLAALDYYGHVARGSVANALLYNNDARSLIENAVGGNGNDTLTGNSVGNRLEGGNGADFLQGMAGSDLLYGGSGADTLDGGIQGDVLDGGDGNDVLIYDNADTLVGGSGSDTVIASDSSTYNTLALSSCVSGVEYVSYNGQVRALVSQHVFNGTSGNDNLTGTSLNDTLNGLGGNDQLVGGLGIDLLYGGDGNDTLRGGGQQDTLDAGAGNDVVYYGGSQAIYNGGAGSDTLLVSSQADYEAVRSGATLAN
ncbi:M10 family metallopeptidase, partial [Anaeromusa sp.]|uniref:M10 family metallopeptidase n=1 Tax=Anaeromusa sp. TaxID=1872520 RepID=UPI002635BFA8